MPPHRPSMTSTPRAPSVRRGNRLSATLQDSPLDRRTTEGLRDRSRRVLGGKKWTVKGSVGASDRAGRRREEQPAGHPVSTQAKGWRAAPGTAALHRFPRWRGGTGRPHLSPLAGRDGAGRIRAAGGKVIGVPTRPGEEPTLPGFRGRTRVLIRGTGPSSVPLIQTGSRWRHPRPKTSDGSREARVQR